MSSLIDWKLKRRAGFFPFLGLKPCRDVSISSNKSLQRERLQCLKHAASMPGDSLQLMLEVFSELYRS